MEAEEILKNNFVEAFLNEGFSKVEALESWEVIWKTYEGYLSKYFLPGVLSNMTDRELLEYLKESGELDKIREVALQRLNRLP